MAAAGLKVVAPSTPADAKGLMASAIADPDPVVFLMDVALAGHPGARCRRDATSSRSGSADVSARGGTSRSWR